MGFPRVLTDNGEMKWLMVLLLWADQSGLVNGMLKHHNSQYSDSGILTIFLCIPKLPYKVIRSLYLSEYYFSNIFPVNLYVISMSHSMIYLYLSYKQRFSYTNLNKTILFWTTYSRI